MDGHDDGPRIRALVVTDRPWWIVSLGDRVARHRLPIDLVPATAGTLDGDADVALVDLVGDAGDGALGAVERLARRHPPVPVVVAVDPADARRRALAHRAGAAAAIARDASPAATVALLLAVASGAVVLHDRAPGPGPDAIDLTDSERLLLAAVARGDDNQTIGRTLYASERTVKRRLSALYQRLGVSGRVEAVAVAARAGLLDAPDP